MGSTDGSPIADWENEEKMDEAKNSKAISEEKL